MSEFAVEVLPIRIEPHPNADSIELAVVGAYRSVVQKGRYRDGDLVAYIPEASIVPDTLLEEMELTGKLAGAQKNRVKPIRLRGVVSEGLCYPARPEWTEGQDVAQELGITKWEPAPPTGGSLKTGRPMQGWFSHRTLKYDIENYKRFPNVLIPGEWVIATEKLHGTFAGYSLVEGEFGVFSKGLGSRGFLIDPDRDNPGVYVEVAREFELERRMREVLGPAQPAFLLGEIFGKSIQDLHYGIDTRTFRVFDIKVGDYFMGPSFLRSLCDKMGLETVPMLYEGPFDLDQIMKLRDGPATIGGGHVREGVVVRSTSERRDPKIGRVQLKFVSEAYLFRGGKTTEFN